jgi:hypothetical protein
MTLDHFKDYSAGLESLAIVGATMLGGWWAIYQFLTLRARDKAKLELDKARKDLVEHGILLIELVTESFPGDDGYLLHVQVVLRNIGNRSEIIDWSKTAIFARRFYKTDGDKLGADGQILGASPALYLDKLSTIFSPGYTLNQSFLIPIPQPGVYYLQFSLQASPVESVDLIKDMARAGAPVDAKSSILVWSANKFVSIPQVQPAAASAVLTKT